MKPSQSIFPMNDQHRATDSEWYCLEARTSGSKADVVAYSCILELRDRIKALEAAQQAHNHPLYVIDPERQKMAQESSQAAGFAPEWPGNWWPRWSDFERCAASTEALKDAKPADSQPQPNHPEIPGGSLLSRVACADSPADAILEVAAWLREHYGGLTASAALLEREAKR